jgi:hypothetical protein
MELSITQKVTFSVHCDPTKVETASLRPRTERILLKELSDRFIVSSI